MKNYTVLLLIILLAINSTTTAQDVLQGVLWVTINDESARPVVNSNTTSNETINQVFGNYNVLSYKSAFPSAQSDLLKNTYEINFTGNGNILVLKPNPANNYVIAQWILPESTKDPYLYISNIDGRFIEKIKINGFQNEKVISMGHYKPGTYILSIISDGVKYDSKKLSIVK